MAQGLVNAGLEESVIAAGFLGPSAARDLPSPVDVACRNAELFRQDLSCAHLELANVLLQVRDVAAETEHVHRTLERLLHGAAVAPPHESPQHMQSRLETITHIMGSMETVEKIRDCLSSALVITEEQSEGLSRYA